MLGGRVVAVGAVLLAQGQQLQLLAADELFAGRQLCAELCGGLGYLHTRQVGGGGELSAPVKKRCAIFGLKACVSRL